MSEAKTKIPARLESAVVGGYVTGAADVYDDSKSMDQASINAAVDTTIGDDSTEGSIKGRIKDLEDNMGPGGSVEEQINNKIATLDASVSQTAGADGLALSVTEADGKVTSVSGSIAANTYDAHGAAATAKTELLGDAAADYNTLGKLEDAIQAEATTRGNADEALDGRLDTVEGLIPSQAATTNQLADKAFVNSSISTATANFKGTKNLVTDLNLTISATESQVATALATAITGADNNDYAFVQIPTADATPTEIARVDRYKYNGTAWSFEYSLNNSSYTAAQWAAINSGITSTLVTAFNAKYDLPATGMPSTDMSSAVQSSLGKADSAYQKPSSGIPSTDMTSEVQSSLSAADSAYQKPSGGIPDTDLSTGVQTSLGLADSAYQLPSSGIPDTDLSSAVQTSLGKADTAVQPAALDDYYTETETNNLLSGKQDTLVSGTSIKTINNESLLGSGNITIQGGGSSYTAGDGIDITNDEITVKAGSNLSFDSNGNLNATDTTYSVMGGSGASHASGLVPDPGATAGTTKYLREDGSWAVPEGSNTDVNYDTTNKKVTKTINNVTSDVVTAATIVEDGGGLEVEIGETSPTDDVKLFVDTDADPAETFDVYTRYEVDQKLAFRYDASTKGIVLPTDTSIVEYDSSAGAIVFHG